MEIQLNAESDEERLSHTVPMSSLLSSDVETPRDTSDPPPALASLMNSPMEVSTEDETPGMPHFQDEQLETLKDELTKALQKQFGESTTKRHKKSKSARRRNANAAEAQVKECFTALQQKISSQFTQKQVLEEVTRFCLGFCGFLDEKDGVQGILVKKDSQVDVDATVGNLPSKPLYFQLVGAMRRAVMGAGEAAGELLRQVLDWCLARDEPDKWTWMLAAMAQMNAYCVHEFLFHEALTRYRTDCRVAFMPVLELLAEQHPAQMVDMVRDLLEECAEGQVATLKLSAVDAVTKLVALASESAVLVKACDDNLQWIVTDQLVTTLANKFTPASTQEANGSAEHVNMTALLLEFIRMRSAELPTSGFQLILLLQNLAAAELPPPFASCVASFQKELLAFAATESSRTFVKGVYRFLPFICQNTLRLLKVMTPVDEDETMEDGDKMSKEDASRRFTEWKRWLCLLAQSISREGVTDQVIKAELMLAEFNELPLTLPLTAVQPADRALCELLTELLVPPSSDYVTFVRNIVQECQSAAPRARRRILGIIQTLLRLNDSEALIPTTNDFPVELHAPSSAQDSSCLQQLAASKSWHDSQDAFALWRGVRGVDFWESFVDLACSKDSKVASRALSLASRIPFLSLEDPAWQYRCVRKLSSVFFSLLRQYRTELVQQDGTSSNELVPPQDGDIQSRLQSLKMIMFRVLALDGGVAHYASSVYSVFASLWLDALLSTTSATSIPTHFPNGVNFADMDGGDGVLDERAVIRCERTISSKCTNLQSSQVITKVPETRLVYRKTLDSSWEREMHAARVCSVYATDLFTQLLTSTGSAASLLADPHTKAKAPATDEDELCERRLKVVVDMLLERVIPCCGIPSDEIYKDTLPNRSSFDVDLRVEQWLNHFPAFLPLLRAVVATSTALGSSQILRLVPVFKSALIVLLGHWNSVKGELSHENLDVPPYMRNQNQLALTCELMRLLRATTWLPVPLGRTAELLPLTTPADIRSILFSCWFYLSDHPPRSGSRAPTPATSATTSPISSGSSPAGFSISGLSTGGSSSSSSHPPTEFYLIPLRKALHRNIRKIGPKYPLFMC